jgi:hypothetical protein
VTNKTSFTGSQCLHLNETSGDTNDTRIEIWSPPFTGLEYIEINLKLKINDGRGVIQVKRKDGQHVFMLNCFSDSHWQYWTNYGNWTVLNYAPASTDTWHNVSIIVDSVDSRFRASIDGVGSGWIPAEIDWESMRFVSFRGNDNFPGDFWVDDLYVSHVNYNPDWDVLYVNPVENLLEKAGMEDDRFYHVNYTGLPEGEDVRIHPVSHVFSGNEFGIVFENNRNQSLYWGADWKAEKWVDGEWVTPEGAIFYTLDLRHTEPYGSVFDSFSFPFDAGLYRITKRCMLSDNYDRDKRVWVDEFTASFYIIKTQ